MILLLFLIFVFISITCEQRNSILLGYLGKNQIQSVNKNGYCFYLKLSDYTNDDVIKINATVYSGYFTEKVIFYGAHDVAGDPGYDVEFSDNIFYSSYTEGDYIDSGNYKKYTHIFNFQKVTKWKYLYISVPYFSGSRVDIVVNYKPSEPSGSDSIVLSLTAVIGIVAGVVILIIIIIIICCVRRSKRENNQLDYMKPVPPNVNIVFSSANTPNPNANSYAASVSNYPSNAPPIPTTYNSNDSPATYQLSPASPVYPQQYPNNYI